MRRAADPPREAGAAVADFVLVGSLLVVLFVGVLQVGLSLYVRNTLISCSSEGARLGARADANPADGIARTRALIDASLPRQFASDVTAQVVQVDGIRVLSVRVRAPLPVIGLLGPARGFDVVGRAFLERQ
ncbi:MAG TPA: TadE/TadG family type IV pilus assembly protein [Pedococcus sp.]|jgi:Flp pilus assembly protein TadG|nr:TadE/TadG family type IV pilus assembly protein [Pedococcus sp.]